MGTISINMTFEKQLLLYRIHKLKSLLSELSSVRVAKMKHGHVFYQHVDGAVGKHSYCFFVVTAYPNKAALGLLLLL